MRKASMILLMLVSVVAWLAYQRLGNTPKLEEAKVVKQSPVGRVKTAINWSEASPDAQTYQIRFEQVVAAVKNGAKCYDVRSFIEYQLSHVTIAEHYSLTSLDKQEFPSLVHDVPIYLYGSDSVSSARAAKLLRDEGFQYVYDLGSLDQVEAIGAELSEWW